MLKDRIKKVREYLKIGSQEEFSEKTNFPLSRIKDLERGKVKALKPDEAIFLEDNFHFSGWWLLTGKGQMLLSDNNSLSINGDDGVLINGSNNIDSSFNRGKIKKTKAKQGDIDELVDIPYFEDTYAAAGHGAINYDEAPHPMSLNKSFLRSKFGITSFNDLHIINASGDSMEPTFRDGELLMIMPFENENNQIKSGSIYVLSFSDSVLVKRVEFNPVSKEMTLISDNTKYSPLPIPREQMDECKIIGRVIGHFGRI